MLCRAGAGSSTQSVVKGENLCNRASENLFTIATGAVCHAERSEVSLFSRIARFFALLKMTFSRFVILNVVKYLNFARCVTSVRFGILHFTSFRSDVLLRACPKNDRYAYYVMLNSVKYLCFLLIARFFALLKMTFSQFVILNAVKYLCFCVLRASFGLHTGRLLQVAIASLMMVGQVVYDCVCPVELLHEQQANHLVRECHL